ncbi:MAG TPA: hypothetical protein VIW24_20865 [Aldersonia sp.]
MATRVLYREPGGRWRALAYGPTLCLVVAVVEIVTGARVHWLVLPICAVLLAGATWVQIVAARRHVSVEVTTQALRNGTESLPLSDVAAVLEPPDEHRRSVEPWETARTLGELADVPRRRTAVGLRLQDGSLVRAWARDDAALRQALATAVAG